MFANVRSSLRHHGAMVGLLGLGATLLLTGCYDPVKAPDPGLRDPLVIQAYPKITVDRGLSRFLGFSDPIVEATPDKPLNVTVPVRLLEDYAVNVQYRFIFVDNKGRPIQPEMGFQYIRMPARVQVFFKGAALDTNAVDWFLQVRSAQ